jgi:hypothetical protein
MKRFASIRMFAVVCSFIASSAHAQATGNNRKAGNVGGVVAVCAPHGTITVP